MPQFNSRQLAYHLKTACVNARILVEGEKPALRSSYYIVREGGLPQATFLKDPVPGELLLNRSGYDALKSFAEEIRYDPAIGDFVGEMGIAIESSKALLKLHDSGCHDRLALETVADVARRLRDLVRNFTVFLDVEHLMLADLTELRLGNVLLRTPEGAKTRINEISPGFHESQSRVVPGMGSMLGTSAATLLTTLAGRQPSTSSCVAEVCVRADAETLQSLAEAKVDEGLDLLRCMIMNRSFIDRGKFGLSGSVASGMRRMVYTCEDIGFANEDKWQVGTQIPVFISPESLESMKTDFLGVPFAFNELCHILQTEDSQRTKLERSIVIAMRWIARLQKTDIFTDHVIAIAVALETLLIGEERGEKADMLATRVMTLLGGRSVEQRLKMFSNVKRFYSTRSNIVHGIADSKQKREYAMTRIALQALSTMAIRRSEWRDHDEFAKWVRSQILAPH